MSYMIRKRIVFVLMFIVLSVIGLILRIGWLQFYEGERLRKEAIRQQIRDNIINPSRGAILERNGITLAVSVSVETVSASPNEIAKSGNAGQVALALSQVLEMNYQEVYEKITKSSEYEIIKRRIEKSKADQIREKGFKGIYLEQDSKRYYPYDSFASHVIGATGIDDQGLFGIEAAYDKYLKGQPGREVSMKGAIGAGVPFESERHINAENGFSVVLTIDETIQHLTEKHLEKAMLENKVAKSGTAIVMEPNSGEILAMAVKPDFNLNNPFEIMDEKTKKEVQALTGKDFTERYNAAIENQWRNKAISDSYEPGSTFKIITAAAALEEHAVKMDDLFNCIGYAVVAGQRINCWRYYRPHGIQTFAQTLQNSCNPSFIEIAQGIGPDFFQRYVRAFGFMEKTGVDFIGESKGIFHTPEKFNQLELATASFGQGFQVTPLQMVTAISAVANGGNLVKPRLVKQLINNTGQVVETFDTQIVRQVVSKQTSNTMKDILKSVVSEGTGKNAYIKGYEIAGKTGTSEKLPRMQEKYIGSFVGFAPAKAPEVVVLVVLDEPEGEEYSGGIIAAPVVRNIINDIMSYMNVEPRYTEQELMTVNVDIPYVTNMDIQQAQEILKSSSLSFRVEGNGTNVTGQVPEASSKVVQQSEVVLFTEGSKSVSNISIPNVLGKSITDVRQTLREAGLNLAVIDSDFINANNSAGESAQAIRQEPASGMSVPLGSVISVEFRHKEVD